MNAFITLLVFFFASTAYSQSGTYTLVSIPREAFKANSEGVFEYPIYIGTATFKLRRTKRAIVIYDEGEDTEERLKGNWSKEGDFINVEIASKDEIIAFVLVQYESGTYLKRVNGNQHYKKQ